MDKKGLVTTIDNPFDPFVQWNEWLAYDQHKQYYTCEFIAKLAQVSPDDDETEKENKLQTAIEFLLDYSPIHLLVYPKINDGGEGSI